MSRFAALEGKSDIDEPAAPQQSDCVEPNSTVLDDPLFWLDLEMTGLDSRRDVILEAAMLASDSQLHRTVDGPEIIIHHAGPVLAGMNEWSRQQHDRSGLTERSRLSTTSLAAAEAALLAFVETHCPGDAKAVLAGACVYKDLEFVEVHMPRLRARLSHRVVDVSTVRHLAHAWYPGATRKARAALSAHAYTHHALDDVRHSIAELRYWREHCFRPSGGGSKGGRAARGSKAAAGRREAAAARCDGEDKRSPVAELVSAMDKL